MGAIAHDRHLLKPDVSEEEITALLIATTPNYGFYVAVIILAIFAPKVAVFGYLVVAIFTLLRARGDKTLATTASA
jgi:hypothetical protein